MGLSAQLRINEKNNERASQNIYNREGSLINDRLYML